MLRAVRELLFDIERRSYWKRSRTRPEGTYSKYISIVVLIYSVTVDHGTICGTVTVVDVFFPLKSNVVEVGVIFINLNWLLNTASVRKIIQQNFSLITSLLIESYFSIVWFDTAQMNLWTRLYKRFNFCISIIHIFFFKLVHTN